MEPVIAVRVLLDDVGHDVRDLVLVPAAARDAPAEFDSAVGALRDAALLVLHGPLVGGTHAGSDIPVFPGVRVLDLVGQVFDLHVADAHLTEIGLRDEQFRPVVIDFDVPEFNDLRVSVVEKRDFDIDGIVLSLTAPGERRKDRQGSREEHDEEGTPHPCECFSHSMFPSNSFGAIYRFISGMSFLASSVWR